MRIPRRHNDRPERHRHGRQVVSSVAPLVLIDYGLGNLGSVANALQKQAIPYVVSSDPVAVRQAKALILPGVGPAGQGMQNLRERQLDTAIRTAVQNGTPILGICIGMQLFMDRSEEDDANCLGLVSGGVKKFVTIQKVPQIGWNQVRTQAGSKLLKGLPDESYFYFVHSYYCAPDDDNIVAGTTEYDIRFCSVFEQDNIYGVQFHAEKSGEAGLQLLRNYWEAVC